METLFNLARDCYGGALESRMVARMETEGRELTDDETVNECKYLLETFTVDDAGYDPRYVAKVRRACKYIISKAQSK